MATPEQLKEFRKKAYESPDIGKHGPWKETLKREELKAKFIEYFGERFLPILEAIEKAIKDGDVNAAFKALEQLIGKPALPIEGGDPNKPIIVQIEQEIAEKYADTNTEDNR